MERFSIQPAQLSDLEELKNIFLDWYKDDTATVDYFINLIEQSIKGTSTDDSELYVVSKNEEGKVMGMMGYRQPLKKFSQYAETSHPLEIYALFVSKEVVKKGVGGALVSYIKERGPKGGYEELIVRSASNFKETGWPFYLKMGFEERGQIPESGGGISKVFGILL